MTGFDIALVYDLRSDYLARGYSEEAIAEFDTEETIDLIAAALARRGHRIERIGGGRALARCLADGRRFELVFSIAEGMGGRAREAQVAALCELYGQPYVFSDPMTLAVALDKGAAKRLARDAGVLTTPFVVVADAANVPDFGFGFPVFVKPLAEGTGKGCELASLCRGAEELAAAIADLSHRFGQHLIVEPYLSGREFTVGIVDGDSGPEVVGTLEIVMNDSADPGVYSYRNKESSESLVRYLNATDATAVAARACALAAYRALDCRDAARIDIRCNEHGEPYFLEANPLAGLHPTHSDLPLAASAAGHSYDWLMNAIVTAAARRYGLVARPASRTKTKPFVPVLHAAIADRADEADTLESAERICAALERNGFRSEPTFFVPTPAAAATLAASDPRVVFNLVEAIDGHAAGSVLAPWFLDRAGLAYTGNGFAASLAAASKLAAKGVLHAHGLPTPALIDVGSNYDGEVILKPEWEHGSLGLDAASVLQASAMRAALAAREHRHGGRFFAEVYIPGREFNVSLIAERAGVRVLPIQETMFVDWPSTQPRIVDFDAKWAPDSAPYRNTPRRFGIEQTEPALAVQLRTLAQNVWVAFALRGYARVDVRVDAAGMPWVIDVNPNPGLGPDAGFVAAAAAAGTDADALFVHLVDAAIPSAQAA